MYHISGLCHRTDIDMGVHGFCIHLSQEWKAAVATSKLSQESVDRIILAYGRTWLDCAGFNRVFDPDNCGWEADSSLPPGPNVRHIHEPRSAIRVKWGEWGPEHISVPGNACGLDLDRGFGNVFKNGQALTPHNIDGLSQKYLLLMVFTHFAEIILYELRV